METKEIITLLISGMLGTLGFSILFKSNKSRVAACVLGGFIVTGIYIMCVNRTDSLIVQNFIPSLAATVYAEIMARIMKAPATPILTCSLIVLVPGGRLYYTTYYFVISDSLAFFRELTDILQVAAGMCIGITCVSVIVHEINRYKFRKISDKE